MPGKNIYDIAAEAGVSIATVSRVLAKRGNVSPVTAQRVRDVMDKYNYRPSAIARGLNRQKSQMLGLILPELTNPYYAQIYSSVQQAAARQGCMMTLYSLPEERAIDEETAHMLIDRRLDGVLLNGENMTQGGFTACARLFEDIQSYMPIVMLGAAPAEYTRRAVLTDLKQCARIAVEYLLGLGHTRIALVGGPNEERLTNSRDTGYREALAKAGLPYRAEYRAVCRAGIDTCEACMLRLLDALPRAQWPSAVIAVNDPSALGIMRAMNARGLRIPEDISLIGCDNQFYVSYVLPPLTSIDTQPRKVGETAVELLFSPKENEQVYIPGKLVIRQSCAPFSSNV